MPVARAHDDAFPDRAPHASHVVPNCTCPALAPAPIPSPLPAHFASAAVLSKSVTALSLKLPPVVRAQAELKAMAPILSGPPHLPGEFISHLRQPLSDVEANVKRVKCV